MVMGRPTKYSDELADYMCEKIRDGGFVKSLCGSDMKFPESRAQVYRWLDKHIYFRDQYVVATQYRNQNLDDDAFEDVMGTQNEIKSGKYEKNSAAVASITKTRADFAQWYSNRYALKKYAPKINGFTLNQTLSYSEQAKQIVNALNAGLITSEQSKSLLDGVKTVFEISSGELEERVEKLEESS